MQADKTSQILFKNTQPLTLNASITGPGGGGSGSPNVVMNSATGYVTFNGDLHLTAASTYFTLGNCTINAKIGADNNYYYVTALSGCTVTFSETAKIIRRYLGYLYGSGTFRLGCPRIPYDNQEFAQMNCQGGTFICETNVAFKTFAFFFSTSGSGGIFDLNGYDQTLAGITGGSGSATLSPSLTEVKSQKPATVTFNQSKYVATYMPYVWNSSLVFSGAVTFNHSIGAAFTNRFWNGVSTTTGDLNVTGGTLVFAGNAQWKGPKVNVTGGRVVTRASAGSFGGETTVSVCGSGVLEVPAGCAMCVGDLVLDGDSIEIGSGRTIAELRELEEGKYAAFLAGEGEIFKPCDFYVDAEHGNDETGDGLTEETAVKTLAKAVTLPRLGGSRIVALPGTYDEKTMAAPTIGDSFNKGSLCRVVVPANMVLISRDGPATTIIKGAKASEPLERGCGPDAVRCVFLQSNARIEGFTLTDGYGYYDGTGNDGNGNGACVYAVGDGCMTVGCVLKDSTAGNIAAGCQGRYYRCVIKNTHSRANYAVGLRNASAYGCLFVNNDSVVGQFCTGYEVESCTFVGSTSGVRNYDGVVRNCVFSGANPNTVDYKPSFYSCRYTQEPQVHGTIDASCAVVTAAELALDGQYRPTKSSCLVNAGDLEAYRAAMDRDPTELDVYGAYRFHLGGLDIGAAEYDPREDIAKALAVDGTVAVAEVTTNVTETASPGALLPDESEMSVVWANCPFAEVSQFSLAYAITDGTLLVYTNGVAEAAVEIGPGEGNFQFKAEEPVTVRFVHSGVGAAEVSAFNNAAKAVIVAEKGGIEIVGANVGTNYVGATPLTFTVRRKFDSGDRVTSGLLVNGTFVSFDENGGAVAFTVSDAASSLRIETVYAEDLTEWYVNADPDKGGDDNFGRHPDNPFRTLAKAAGMAVSGDTIHAARGVYDEGVMGSPKPDKEGGTCGLCRVVLKPSVSLVADEGRDVTAIEGAMAEPADARVQLGCCGTNAIRCVYLNQGAQLRGFTLRNGYGYSTKSDSGEYAGGVHCGNTASTALIVDCVISNCVAHGGAAGHRGSYVNCRVEDNEGYLGYRIGINNASVFNCYFRNNHSKQTNQGHITDCGLVVNCYFAGTQPGMRSSGESTSVYNSVFCGNPVYAVGDGKHVNFHNAYAVQLPDVAASLYTWNDDCVVTNAAALAISADTLAPASRDSILVDSETAWQWYTNKVASAVGLSAVATDVMGCPRMYNGRLDIGAAEYDWREIYRADLGAKRWLAVEAVSSNVVETADGAVRLADGSELTLKFTIARLDGEKFVDIPFVQSGAGTLTATLDGAVIEPKDGAFVIKATAAEQTLVLAYSGEGYADLTKMRRNAGVLLLVR